MKVLREVMFRPVPVIPGSTMANGPEIRRIMLEESTDFQKRSIDLINGKRLSFTPWSALPPPDTKKPVARKGPTSMYDKKAPTYTYNDKKGK